jgi:hypothetical protein
VRDLGRYFGVESAAASLVGAQSVSHRSRDAPMGLHFLPTLPLGRVHELPPGGTRSAPTTVPLQS